MNEKTINVLSLFDGISCAYLALEKAGIKINKYYSSEIDKSALAIQNHHYSGNTNFIQLGDVCKIDGLALCDEVDLIIFGSPCTQLSAVNPKDRSGLEGPDSKLFYEALRILKEIYAFQPFNKKLYFLMENVASMSNNNRNKITAALSEIFKDVQLIKIDSALVAPAHRRRLYWTNIPNVSAPKPNGVKYQDIVETGYVDRDKGNVLLSSNVTLTNGITRFYTMGMGNIIFRDKEFAELPVEEKLSQYPSILKASGYVGRSRSAPIEYLYPNGCYRHPSIKEYSRMMTIPNNYLTDVEGVSKTEKQKLIGLAFTVDVVAHLLKPLDDVI